MLAILIRGHGTKARGSWQPGASADLDGDGVVEQEARLVPRYLAEAYRVLAAADHEVEVYATGSYESREAHALEVASLVPGARVGYVQAHCNAGGGDYGLIGWRTQSPASQALADRIAAALRAACPELAGVRSVDANAEAWPRMYRILVGIPLGSGIAAVCYEPCFVDCPAHRPLLAPEGLARIGQALARGLGLWGETP